MPRLGGDVGDRAVAEVHGLDDEAHPFRQGLDRGAEVPALLGLEQVVPGERQVRGDEVVHGLVERRDGSGGVAHRVDGGLLVDAHGIGDLLRTDAPAEACGQGLLRGQGLADPLPGAAGGPVGRAHVVGQRTGDPGACVGAERHAEGGVEGLGGCDECERSDGGEVVAVQVRRPGADVGHDVAHEREVLHDHRVAFGAVHAVPLVDLTCVGSPVRGRDGRRPRMAGAYAEDPPGSLRAVHPASLPSGSGCPPGCVLNVSAGNALNRCSTVPSAGVSGPVSGRHLGGLGVGNGRSCPPTGVIGSQRRRVRVTALGRRGLRSRSPSR